MQIDKIIHRILILCSCFLAYGQDPLTMGEAIELLKENNPHVRMSHENQLLAQKAENQYYNRFIPKINPLQMHYDAVNRQADLKASTQWELPTGGNVQLSYQKAYDHDPRVSVTFEQPVTHNTASPKATIRLIDTQIRQFSEQLRYEQLVLKMRKAYYQCVMDQMMLEHQKSHLEDIKKEIERYEIQYKGGEISKLELEKTLNQHERTSINYLKQEQSAELHQIELKRLLGIPLRQPIHLDTNVLFSMRRPSTINAMNLALYGNIPYQVAKLQFEKAKLQYEIAKTHSLPKVSVYAKANEKKHFNAGVTVQLAMPDSESDYQETKMVLDYRHAEQTFIDQDAALRTKIHQLLISLENQVKLIDLSAKNLQLQQSIYNTESIKFKHQQISLVDFQKASNQLQEAYRDSLKTQIEYSHLRDELLHVIGDFSSITQTENNHV